MPKPNLFSEQLSHYIFCLLLIGLPFSKGLVSIAFVGLILLSLFLLFKDKLHQGTSNSKPYLLVLPIFIFVALAISLLYSNDLKRGLKILTSNIEFLAIPFLFGVNYKQIKSRLFFYINLLISTTATTALLTFLLFLFPSGWTQQIANALPFLQDYIVHEKTYAFGTYSPFMDRLQFSYLLGACVFLQLWFPFRYQDKANSLAKNSSFGKDFSPFEGGRGDVKSLLLMIFGMKPKKDKTSITQSNSPSVTSPPLEGGGGRKSIGYHETKTPPPRLFSFFPKESSTLQRGKSLVPIAETTNKTNLTSFLKLAILIITLLILGARGAQISFLIASSVWIIGAYWYWLHPRLSKQLGKVSAYSLLIGGLLFFLVALPFFAYKNIPAVKMRYDQMRWEIGTFQDGTFTNYDYTHFTSIRRLLSWRNSWTLIQDYPFLGVGIGDYQTVMEAQYAKDDLGFPVNTQSQYLYYWLASGMLGLLALLFLMGSSLIHFIRQPNFPLKLLGASFLLFYSSIFVFDAPLNFQMGAMTFLVVFGFIGIINNRLVTL